MIKIFQIISSVHLGGAENVAFRLIDGCNQFAKNQFDFRVIEVYKSSSFYSKNKKKELHNKRIEYQSLSFLGKRLSLFFAPLSLFWLLLWQKPQIIHSHTDIPDFVLSITIRLLKFFRIKEPLIVRTIHNTELWPTYPKVARFVESVFNTDFVVGVSKKSLDAYKELRKDCSMQSSEKLAIVENGVPEPLKEDCDIRIDDDKINMVFCGRFEKQKGIDVLIKRIRKCNDLYQEKLNFYLIGEGTYRSEALRLESQFDNVFVFEPLPNIANKFYLFDYIIMPSRFEGLVLTSIEASFSKVPVIAARAPGLTETLPPTWPLLFDLENESEFLQLIDKIMIGSFDLNNLRNIAYEYVNERFSIDTMVKSYISVYNELLKS